MDADRQMLVHKIERCEALVEQERSRADKLAEDLRVARNLLVEIHTDCMRAGEDRQSPDYWMNRIDAALARIGKEEK